MSEPQPPERQAQDPAAAGPDPESLSQDIVAIGALDREAFRRVYAASADKLFAICLAVTRNRAAAEDVLQDSYLKIWDRAQGYDPARSRPMAWLCAIARNTAIDWYRAQNRHRLVGDDGLESTPSEAVAADERIIDMDREQAAWTAVDELDGESKAELKSVFLRGMTYPEAARRLKMPVATFKSRVRRTVLRMRKKLSDD